MPDYRHELELQAAGHPCVAGVDEAGRGPLAGPVVAAAVILSPQSASDSRLAGLNDSKQLSPAARSRLFPQIQLLAAGFGIGIVSAALIDRINILQATYLAMWRAIRSLPKLDYLLVDGKHTLPYWEGPQAALIKGDSRSLSIAAASVLAKETRDRIMVGLAQQYPGYGLAKHMGYPTAEHRRLILELGPSPQHRLSFCRKLLAQDLNR